MIDEPPGEPSTCFSLLSLSKMMVGDIELRGRLPGSTRLATGCSGVPAEKEKSVSSLLSRKPRTIRPDPKLLSIVVVIETALPDLSTIEIWLVAGRAWGDPPHTPPGRTGRAPPPARPPS